MGWNIPQKSIHKNSTQIHVKFQTPPSISNFGSWYPKDATNTPLSPRQAGSRRSWKTALQAGCDRDHQHRGFLKWWVGTPQIIPLNNRGFSIIFIINHPFWGKHPYFWKDPYGHFKGCFISCVCSICVTILSYTILVLPCNHPFDSLGYTAKQLNMSLLF